MAAEAPVLERTLNRDVAAALEPLRRKQRDLQAFMASQLERLEHQAGEVERRESDLAAQAEHLATQTEDLAKARAALDEEWSHLDALVETAQANAREIIQEKQKLASLLEQQSESGVQSEIRRLEDALEQSNNEREVLEAELASAQRKIGQLADVAVELNEVRDELERLRHESSRGDAAVVEELRRKLAAAEQEREDERRRYTAERAAWLTEIRSLSRSIGSGRNDVNDSSMGSYGSGSHGDGGSPRGTEQPLDAVLNRFEAMKRDLAKHRPPRK
jgi:chromosome segregation ATPase